MVIPATFASAVPAVTPADSRIIGSISVGSDNESADAFAARFWATVTKTATCWIWTGARNGGAGMQHGSVNCRALRQTPQKAHRVAWVLTRGPIPTGQQVNHHCDVPLCCNPDHLYLGSQRDNMRDASVRGRLTVPRTRKLTQAERLTIYHTPRYRGLGADLARSYGVSEVCIHFVRQGRFVGSGVWK